MGFGLVVGVGGAEEEVFRELHDGLAGWVPLQGRGVVLFGDFEGLA